MFDVCPSLEHALKKIVKYKAGASSSSLERPSWKFSKSTYFGKDGYGKLITFNLGDETMTKFEDKSSTTWGD